MADQHQGFHSDLTLVVFLPSQQFLDYKGQSQSAAFVLHKSTSALSRFSLHTNIPTPFLLTKISPVPLWDRCLVKAVSFAQNSYSHPIELTKAQSSKVCKRQVLKTSEILLNSIEQVFIFFKSFPQSLLHQHQSKSIRPKIYFP